MHILAIPKLYLKARFSQILIELENSALMSSMHPPTYFTHSPTHLSWWLNSVSGFQAFIFFQFSSHIPHPVCQQVAPPPFDVNRTWPLFSTSPGALISCVDSYIPSGCFFSIYPPISTVYCSSPRVVLVKLKSYHTIPLPCNLIMAYYIIQEKSMTFMIWLCHLSPSSAPALIHTRVTLSFCLSLNMSGLFLPQGHCTEGSVPEVLSLWIYISMQLTPPPPSRLHSNVSFKT